MVVLSLQKTYIADVRLISSCAESFSESCEVPVRVYDGDGKLCCSFDPVTLCCTFCRAMSEKLGMSGSDCSVEYERALKTAERLGGRYIYSCARGFVHFASPIIFSDNRKGVIIGGPLLLTDVPDYIAFDLGGGGLYDRIEF